MYCVYVIRVHASYYMKEKYSILPLAEEYEYLNGALKNSCQQQPKILEVAVYWWYNLSVNRLPLIIEGGDYYKYNQRKSTRKKWNVSSYISYKRRAKMEKSRH